MHPAFGVGAHVFVQRIIDQSLAEVEAQPLGDPVDPATARALFEPFDSPGGGQSGITVGLYLARALTVVHGGTVGMEQDERHCVLWVRVPDPPSAAPHHQEETP